MKKVLIVEDDPNQRALYAEELTEQGYEVLAAEDGPKALRLADERQPDAVVLDINMPGMDGLDVLGRLLSARPRLPVIIHTAYPAYEDDFMTWSADAYVCKSSDLTELKQRLGEVLVKR